METTISKRRLILRSFQSPGDIVMLTAAIRDLHAAAPGRFLTDVRTSADALFENNPHITRLSEGDAGVESLDMHYPLVHQSNQRPYHFIHGYAQFLEEQLGLRIPVTRFAGDIHLSAAEKRQPPPRHELGIPEHFWIVIAGGKYDFTAKWWNPASYQAVVDHFRGKIFFVQCGEAGHWHPPLDGVINLVGKTSTREFVRLVYHADGVLCPVTLAMHLAAAVETKPGRIQNRPCVVVAGGREPAHWEAYPQHQFLSTNGALSCCQDGGCWKSRCQLVGDGDPKDRHDLCEQPVQIRTDVKISRCMDMITADDVIRRIEMYYDGGAMRYTNGRATAVANSHVPAAPEPPVVQRSTNVLIKFSHGLGDAVQLTCVLRHLAKYRPDCNVDVASLIGKHTAHIGLCRRALILNHDRIDESQYHHVFDLGWFENYSITDDSPCTKVCNCLREVFGIQPDPELLRYEIHIGPESKQVAGAYLHRICNGRKLGERYPAVAIHYQGNTSADKKNLSYEDVKLLCQELIRAGYVPVILDWDHRSPLPDQQTIFCPDAETPDLWRNTGTGDAERLAALISQCALMVGVDSGPLHVAGATDTPTIACWIGHLPIQFFDLCPNVLHLVPENWRAIPPCHNPKAVSYFETHYRFEMCKGLRQAVVHHALRMLGPLPQRPDEGLEFCSGFWVRKDNFEQDLVIVQDVFTGDAYRTTLLSSNAGPQVVVDIGAHIGCFAKLWHGKNPQARIICVEACPENLPALRANVGDFAEIVQAACTYETEPVALLNAVRPNCESTGGSVVVPRSEFETTNLRQPGYKYWNDLRELSTVTLEQLMQRFGFDHIDVLKLDCEGSEYSILGQTPSLDRIRIIVGEYHVRSRWEAFRHERMRDWDYGEMLDGGEPGGLFHYANPIWPPNPRSGVAPRRRSDFHDPDPIGPPSAVLPNSGSPRTEEHRTSEQGGIGAPIPSQAIDQDSVSPAEHDFLNRLEAALFPDDRPQWVRWEPYYRRLFQVACRLQAHRVVEIGVRAGYSGLTFLSAVPGAHVTGYDAAIDPESLRHLEHAERLLAGQNYRLVKADSHGLDRLPAADLVYIDGDHTTDGCLADLELAGRSAPAILVDDFGTGTLVSAAVEKFLSRHPDLFDAERIDFHFGGDREPSAFLLLTRRCPIQSPPALLRPPLLHVAVPAGIGDSVWALMKVPAMLRAYGAEKAHISLCGGPPYRAKEFLERFDFVASAGYSQWECIEADRYTPEGVYNWAPSGSGWHYQFDWMLQANRHLESGQRLETWLPEFETDFRIADRFLFTGGELRQARALEQELGPYCVFYLGPELGNSTFGHNRGPLWKPEDWGALATLCRELGLKIVIVGADYDRSYFERHASPHLGTCYDAIGKWPIGQTLAVIQRSRFVVGYQSGIGIFSVYLGIPAACFWRPHGDSIDPSGYVSFSERMASAWASPESLDSGHYLPLIYTRCSPQTIADHAVRHGWHKHR